MGARASQESGLHWVIKGEGNGFIERSEESTALDWKGVEVPPRMA